MFRWLKKKLVVAIQEASTEGEKIKEISNNSNMIQNHLQLGEIDELCLHLLSTTYTYKRDNPLYRRLEKMNQIHMFGHDRVYSQHRLCWVIMAHDTELFHAVVPRLVPIECARLPKPMNESVLESIQSIWVNDDVRLLPQGEQNPVHAALFYKPEWAWELISRGWTIPSINAIDPFPGDMYCCHSFAQNRPVAGNVPPIQLLYNGCKCRHPLLPPLSKTEHVFTTWLNAYDRFLRAHHQLCHKYEQAILDLVPHFIDRPIVAIIVAYTHVVEPLEDFLIKRRQKKLDTTSVNCETMQTF